MPTFHHTTNSQSDLVAALQACHDAGIDPAFDSDMEELEHQFQEFRFASASE